LFYSYQDYSLINSRIFFDKKLKLIKYILSILTIFTIFNCSKSNDEYVLKIASSAPIDEPGSRALLKFAELVNERSHGRIKAKLFANGSLGNNRDVTEGLLIGSIEMQMASSSPLAVFVPSLNIFEMPFLFKNNKHMFAVLDSHIGDRFKSDFKKSGLHLLGYFTFGVRHIMTRDSPVYSISDLNGLKIRTMESKPHLDAFKAFGANPLPMAYSDLYTGLETGVIDGAEAANSNYYSKKFFEVAPYWAQVGWLRLVAPVIMSKVFYDKLPEDLKKVINKTLSELVNYERDLYTQISLERLEQLEKFDVTITFPNPKPFQEASKNVYKQWADKIGGWELINEIQAFDEY